MDEHQLPCHEDDSVAEDRRAFLDAAGKFAMLVPPAMIFLLSTTLASEAIARSARCSGSGHDDSCDRDEDDHRDDFRYNNANTDEDK